jgi:hypothetical protein
VAAMKGGTMNRIHTAALVGVALLAACSERQATTAPSVDGTALGRAAVTQGIGSYSWSFTCSATGSATGYWIGAEWWWTENGVELTESRKSASCLPGWADNVSGSDLRPATANGFSACVGASCQSWMFDPSTSFKTHLKGTVTICISDCYPYYGHGGPTKPKVVTLSGTLTIDS